MPKGVEHMDHAHYFSAGAVVKESVMPKGVEHDIPDKVSGVIHRVKESVMPKGVEHACIKPWTPRLCQW